ncbi:indolepyruvate oxidoreductase subunit beta [Tepidibacter mesophilus]|uniref:indolepyruvate oxidoreductase subunit beta n=1 Tax=Tepidibacter mesophilus TaxID=655607 RepID=UPI000C07CD36|nr:indolepyruvate oxidoreductase subunit beta [Tepidibacter mesophilus]
MDKKNILIAGVGGQGLVIATKIISEAALEEGYDVKTNDVIGLSQRGGKVYGSVKIDSKVYSPNIPHGECDILLAMEPMEGYRYAHMIKGNGLAIVNTYRIPSTSIQQEIEEYPEGMLDNLKQKCSVVDIDVIKVGKELGNTKVGNTVLIGIMAKELDIKKETWEKIIKKNVPEKFIDHNIKAFNIGYDYR